jgi:hypothetical protein
MTTIHTGNTTTTGFSVTSDATGNLVIKTGGSGGTTAATFDGASQQATFAAPLSQPGAFMFRNKIINGNFDVWQRGTSQTSGGYVSADRWFCGHGGSTKTASRQAFALGQTDVPNNPKYFMRHVVTSVAGAGNLVNMHHRIEGVETLAGKTATLSFWAKADSSKNIAVDFRQYFGTGGSPSSDVDFNPQKIALTTSWAKYTITVDIPSVSGKTLGTDNNDYLRLIFWFDAGSDYDAQTDSLGQQSGTFDIAQVQLEEGAAATPFEQRPIGMELNLCQRYYAHEVATNATGYATGSGQTARCGTQVNFPVALRTADWTSSHITNQSGTVNNTPNLNVRTVNGASIYWTATGAGSTWWSGQISYDAEL